MIWYNETDVWILITNNLCCKAENIELRTKTNVETLKHRIHQISGRTFGDRENLPIKNEVSVCTQQIYAR